MKEAMFYEKLPGIQSVHCHLCPHQCQIPPNGCGQCGVRKNVDGTLYSLIYSKISSIALDPIEKKPFRRFHPGSFILSVGSVGCNMRCPFCQNYSISRASVQDADTVSMDSKSLVNRALELIPQGNIGIAYTYNEPSVWYEYVYDTARIAKENGLQNVLVTNGYLCREPLEKLLPYIDAMNIDLKSYSEEFYRQTLKGGLEEVKETIRIAAPRCHVEVTTLILPGYNDSVEEISRLAEFLASVSPDIPLHLTRFFPRYQWADKSPTPVNTLYRLKETAEKYLHYVYTGNI